MSKSHFGLIEDLGGAEAYDAALFWALNSLSDQDMAEYDEAMESGDLTLMADFMGQLQNLYQNRSHDIDAWDDAENYVYNEVCTPEMYRNVKEFVSNNYNDADITALHCLIVCIHILVTKTVECPEQSSVIGLSAS